MRFDQEKLDEMERKLCVIADLIEGGNEDSCKIIPASEVFELPTLVVLLPDDEQDLPRIVMMNIVPMLEVNEYTDFIQLYIEFPYDLSNYEEPELLSVINDLNRTIPLGHCITLKNRPDHKYEKMIGMRYMYAISNEREIDDGALIEMMILFQVSCDAVEMRFFGQNIL